jgi:Bacterial TSP3 repeat
MSPRRVFAALLTLGTLGAMPRLAAASPNYPDEIKKQWQIPGPAPDCLVCHQTEVGGNGTSTKPFSRSLQREGLVGMDLGSLDAALAALKAQNTDSDGDGISDIDELQMGSDPNDGPGVFGEFPVPQTGCAIGLASDKTRGDTTTWLLSVVCAGFVARNRRRRGGSSPVAGSPRS